MALIDYEKKYGKLLNNYQVVLFQIGIIPIFVLIFLFFSNGSHNKYNIINFLIFFLSLFICIISLNDIRKNQLKIYNSFLFIFYVLLLWNTFGASGLQLKKDISDLYYYFVGPLIFSFFLFLGDKLKIPLVKINEQQKEARIKKLVIILLTLYILINLYLFTQVGFRLFSGTLIRYTHLSAYTIPGITGLNVTLMWALLMMVPHVNKKLAFVIAITTIMFSGFLHLKRGNIVRVIFFLIVYFFYKNKDKIFKRKNILIISFIMLISVISFGYLGEIRQHDENDPFDIKELVQSNYDNKIVNWIYAYTAFNFDVLKLHIDKPPTYQPFTISLPLMSYMRRYDLIYEYEESRSIYLGISNASTFLTGFMQDFGALYILELIIFSMVVCILIIISRIIKYSGLYIFLQMLIILCFFSNYLVNPAFFTSMLFSIFLYSLCIIKIGINVK